MKFIEVAGNPCPPNGAVARLRAADGTVLRAAHWTPERPPIGTVFLLNGRTEFIDKYFEAAGRLLARSYTVAALDWRGQGLSARLLPDPQKGYVERFRDYECDLEALVGLAAAIEAPRPYLVLAHSMGAHNALRFALHHTGAFDGLALCAPMLRVLLPGPVLPLRALTALLSAMAPRAYALGQGPLGPRDLGFEGNRLTSDRARFQVLVDSLVQEPALRLGGVTNRWLEEAFRSMRMTMSKMTGLRVPAILFSAQADRIADSAIHKSAAQAMGARYVPIEGSRHEILREADRYQDQLWAAFDEWRPQFR